ncbi:MAG: DEAD/DEAH box helicase [bacterium]|nr:DEAD/DEAH box helicase [bacterium]
MQRWIYDQGWTSLHDAQERAIGPILDGDRDVIVAAATAAGKTEAAFLPILSKVATAIHPKTDGERDLWNAYDPWNERESEPSAGVQVLYLSPLKALINDQHQRLEQLCERLDVPVHRWHGDVPATAKRKLVADPSGVLLITPESLEATFVNRGPIVPRLFAGLRYLVIDELHSFLGAQRGVQLQSLMNRVDLATRLQPSRIGLSATLGDMRQAAAFLRPTDPEHVLIVESKLDGRRLLLQMRGYEAPPPKYRSGAEVGQESTGVEGEAKDEESQRAIAEHLFRHLRGHDNLVFANTRNAVETYADLLARRCARARVPNEFWPHHGNLSKGIRQTVETRIKDRTRPATAVSTSTLELGIDIGTVKSVAQIGPPPSVASLWQRLGRSGRRDDPAVLRLYITERSVDQDTHPVDRLRCDIVQATAMVRLMLGNWLESPADPGFNYSTLIQQIMSVIAQHGGATAADLYRALCGAGPFHLVDRTRFARLLRAMGTHDLLIQAADGLLLPGVAGERQINNYRFYTAFHTADEWRVLSGGRTLGTIPIYQPLREGTLLIFAGKRWKVAGVDKPARVVQVMRAAGGVPHFSGGESPAVSDRVRAEMVAVYRSSDIPAWLDPNAQRLLSEGRAAFHRFGLDGASVLAGDSEVLLFPWKGDRSLHTAALALSVQGVSATAEGPAIQIARTCIRDLEATIRDLLDGPRPAPADLAAAIENPEIDKWDWVLDKTLACESVGARVLDVEGAWALLARVAEGLSLDRDGGRSGR